MIEEMLTELLAEVGSKEAVSMSFGYFPAWKSFELKDTFGLALVDQAIRIKESGLKLDYCGIEYEGAKRGMDLKPEIEEAKRLQQFWNVAGRD